MNQPTLTPEQKTALEGVFKATLTVAIKHMDLQKSCLSCVHFREGTELCALVNQRPPARTIVEACEAYETNEPF